MTTPDDAGPRRARHEDEVSSLAAQISFLDEEIAVLRRRLADSPRQVRLLEERLRETESSLTSVGSTNERLMSTLREARDQIVALKEEVDRLAQPPSGFGIFLGACEDSTADVFTGGRKMRVNVSPNVDLEVLRPGQEVVLNEALNVVIAQGYETLGEIVIFRELLQGGTRALVLTDNDRERIVQLAAPLLDQVLRSGDSLLLEPRSGYVFERIPKSEVEELILEEVPNITYADIGGLGPQIEQIQDSVELPYLRRDLFKRLDIVPPKGIFLYGPPGCGKTLIAKALANSMAKRVAEEAARSNDGPNGKARKSYFLNIKGPELLNKYVGETERQLRLLFQRAKEEASEGIPVIIFFDEMDALFRARDSGGSASSIDTIVAQLLSEIDGVEGLANVIVIGASNRETMIDPALLRPGRLDVKIEIGRPGREEASEILSKYLTVDLPYSVTGGRHEITRYRDRLMNQLVNNIFNDSSPDMQVVEVTFESGEKELVGFSRFLSGAILKDIVTQAKHRAMRRARDGEELVIREGDLREATYDIINQTKRLLNTTRFEDWAWISGAKGEKIGFIRTVSKHGQPEREVDIGRIKWGQSIS